jgi:hypothetical protein
MKRRVNLANSSRFAIGAGLASTLFACSALIGLTDPSLDNSVAGNDGGNLQSDVTSTTDGPVVTRNDGSVDAGATCDAALATDPLNCGACGHNCLGGACVKDQCQPILVDDDPTNTSPYDLSIDDDVLFFTNASDQAPYSVRAIAKTAVAQGIGASTLLTGLSVTPYEIATSGTNLLFAGYGQSDNGGKIEKCTTSSCASPAMITGFDSFAVATDGTTVVYGDKFTPEDGGNEVYTVKKTTIGFAASTTLMTFPSEVFWLKIYSGDVYVGVDAFDAPGGVYKCPLTGCATPIQLSAVEPNELYVANDTVYFTSAPDQPSDKDGTVRSVKIDGSNPLTLASGLVVPLGIIADANYVYFSDTGDIDNGGQGQLLRCPLTGCGTNNSLAVDFGQGGNPQGLVDDGEVIYWGDYNGKIYKLAK